MELLLLNEEKEAIDVIDFFASCIWSDRFCNCGTFELYISAGNEKTKNIKKGYYLTKNDSDHAMIVEKQETTSDPENGSYVIITGRSLESILSRRIIWSSTVLSGNFQEGIKKLIYENIISPTDSSRKIDNFKFEESDDEKITSLSFDETYEFFGEELLDTIKTLCKSKKIGFLVFFDDDNSFVFRLYAGTDRSYLQDKNDYVTFSKDFDNFINSSYYESDESLKNVILLTGNKNAEENYSTTVGSGSGLSRRETYMNVQIEEEVTDPIAYMKQKGEKELSSLKTKKLVDGEVDISHMYKYMEDFFLGDTVQLVDEYGNEGAAILSEMVHSQNEQDGETFIPTFDTDIQGE